MERIADKLRPKKVEDIIGHKHIKNILLGQVSCGTLSNIILYGNSGTGKTTFASVISAQNIGDRKVYNINAATATLTDLKGIIKEADYIFNAKGIILVVDELHMFNKREIQALLEYIEKGKITLLGLTTENPYSVLPQGIVSRCLVLQLHPLSKEELKIGIKKAIERLSEIDNKQIHITSNAINALITLAPQGDMRQVLNIIEAILYSKFYHNQKSIKITLEDIKVFKGSKINSDSQESVKYNLISGLQKSIRGSDVDASLYYLGRLLYAEELVLTCRRLSIIAHEDISLANINALIVTENAINTALTVGMPEAKIPLANAVVLLALSNKSSGPYFAIKKVLEDISNGEIYDIPNHLKNRNKESGGQPYLYPHDYPGNYVQQQYLPDELVNKKYYIPGENYMELTLVKSLTERKNKTPKRK